MDKKMALRLSLTFAAIYFFSTNGMASLPGLAVSYLLKDVLKMTASQASYFGAVTLLGWVIKPLWGMISDALPLFGYRRKSYLILTSLVASAVWFMLGQVENYTIALLLTVFTLSNFFYAFNDVVCDGLMVQTGKPHNLTGKFQSWQWGAVYVAQIFTSLAGGWVATNLKNQTIFSINAVFPLMVLALVLFFVKEEKAEKNSAHWKTSVSALKEAGRDKVLWFVAFFIFFWNFSPSYGTPFFYYANDVLKFEKMFFGYVGAVGSATSVLGAMLFSRYSAKVPMKKLIYCSIVIAVITNLSDLIYFTPFILNHLWRAKVMYIITAGTMSILGTFITLAMMNLAAVICPKYSEGTVFAALMSVWNLGNMGSSAFGGYMFDLVGLKMLIVVSATFTAAAWPLVRFLKLEK
ncbi:MAG: hypothetical protein A2654_03075 [Candidatus Nealsonbacteria bacterium RIFCSPHIGHO2_01_FULL_43_31]|uniref:Major facilitator superfamily (MFS) profile domain-containing protein n=1 Tax=Candidatus Nealsonbacteria bacterium RIFCSPHIGHO2_01_FULL_43_31 TaxID=1801665 RepID=A0A1G2E5D9_9BACT|nr:MAG: hypothetical protein A2654_03075 [Candidatus Nealsonbacteria bacterium RIFCSPHIGHO2_01_FULL_43_31]